MARTRRYFWSAWPPASQQRFFKIVLLGLTTVIFSVFVGMSLFGGTLTQQIEESKEQYGRVVPLVQDILALRAQRGDLSHLPVEEAIWRILDDLAIEGKLTSIRSTRLSEDEIGFQITLIGLSQTKLTDFLQDLRKRASLQTPEFTLTRNPDDPRLADVHLVLAR